MTGRFTRRAFLGMLALGGAGGAAAAVGEQQAQLVTRAWRKVFGIPPRRSDMGGLAELRRIGERYLAAHPEERSRALLVADVGPVGDDGLASFARLRDRVRDDFAARRTVTVDGWLLARTEARAAALLALGG